VFAGLAVALYVGPWVAGYFAVSWWLDGRSLSATQQGEVADLCDERVEWLAERVREQEARIDDQEVRIYSLEAENEEQANALFELELRRRW
jgi:hypothetical protein